MMESRSVTLGMKLKRNYHKLPQSACHEGLRKFHGSLRLIIMGGRAGVAMRQFRIISETARPEPELSS